MALFSHRSGGDLNIEIAWSPRVSRTSAQRADHPEVVALLTAWCKTCTHTHNLGKHPHPPGAREAWCTQAIGGKRVLSKPHCPPQERTFAVACFCCDREDGPAFPDCASDFSIAVLKLNVRGDKALSPPRPTLSGSAVISHSVWSELPPKHTAILSKDKLSSRTLNRELHCEDIPCLVPPRGYRRDHHQPCPD